MSTNQRVRLFVAARDLLKALCSSKATQERIMAAIAGMQTELAMATAAIRSVQPAVNSAYHTVVLN